MKGKCLIDCCGDSAYCKGMCRLHYDRTRKHRDQGAAARIVGNDVERFWSKVSLGGPERCWEWSAKSQVSGYGVVYINGKHVLAHRYSYELANGPIPSLPEHHHGHVVMHLCDNRKCVNPAHLALGTQADNCRDAASKGRCVVPKRSGAEHHNRVELTKEQALDIFDSSASGPKLSRQYGVSKYTINRIKNGSHWLLR